MEEKVRKVWDERAKKFGKHPLATGWDGRLRWIEIHEVKRLIPAEGSIIDLGCGNGYVLEQIISQHRKLTGVDISPYMVGVAKNRLKENSEVMVGNILSLPFVDNYFDFAYSIRTLVNVVSKEKQEKAIKEAVRVLKTGGLFLLIECSVEGLENLNRLRRLFGIAELTIDWWNLFLIQERLEATLQRNHVSIIRKMYFPILSILEKVLYPMVPTRLFSLLHKGPLGVLVYYVDRSLCGLFPVLGYDILYAGVKLNDHAKESASST